MPQSDHIHDEIDALKEQLFKQAEKVFKRTEQSFKALNAKDLEAALKLIKKDDKINEAEVKIEEECLRVLALYSPVASDLRLIVTLIKINGDLERIADYAVNICRYVRKIHDLDYKEEVTLPSEFAEIEKAALDMFRQSIESLKLTNTELANKVVEMDDIVDDLNRDILEKLQKQIVKTPDHIQGLLFLHSASRSIERLCDYVTHIAEDVYYLETGKIVRHNNEEMND